MISSPIVVLVRRILARSAEAASWPGSIVFVARLVGQTAR